MLSRVQFPAVGVNHPPVFSSCFSTRVDADTGRPRALPRKAKYCVRLKCYLCAVGGNRAPFYRVGNLLSDLQKTS